MLRKSLFASAVILFAAAAAFGQNPRPVGMAGTIESLHGQTLEVKTRSGKSVRIELSAETRIIRSVKSSFSRIRQGDFIGSAAVKDSDGRLRAQEVHIFPASMRGVGEGHRPMGPNPNRTMTNGDVSQVRSMTNGTVSGVSGAKTRVLTVTYKGGHQEIEVGPSTPVTRMIVGNKTLLKPGAMVTIFGARTEAGIVARVVNVEEGRR